MTQSPECWTKLNKIWFNSVFSSLRFRWAVATDQNKDAFARVMIPIKPYNIIYTMCFSHRSTHSAWIIHTDIYSILWTILCTLVLLTSLCTLQTWATSSISSPKIPHPFRNILSQFDQSQSFKRVRNRAQTDIPTLWSTPYRVWRA